MHVLAGEPCSGELDVRPFANFVLLSFLALSGQDPRGTGGPAGACLHARVRGVGEKAVRWRAIKYHDDLEGKKLIDG